MYLEGDNMKNINWKKCRFSVLGLGILFCVLGLVFESYFRLFLGFSWICIGLNGICFYFFELHEKGSSSKSNIVGAIILFVLAIFYWFI